MSSESLIEGMRVTANGKLGVIREIANQIKVKFDDGSIGFFDANQVTVALMDSRLKGLKDGQVFMEPTATGEDPLAQPKRDTGRGIGESQTVLGKSASFDKLAKRTHSAKWDRCVEEVRQRGGVESPEAVCTAQLGEESYE